MVGYYVDVVDHAQHGRAIHDNGGSEMKKTQTKEDAIRVLNTKIDGGIYQRANVARVHGRKSWREVLETALADYVAKHPVTS
jgi:hypothetical protein